MSQNSEINIILLTAYIPTILYFFEVFAVAYSITSTYDNNFIIFYIEKIFKNYIPSSSMENKILFFTNDSLGKK